MDEGPAPILPGPRSRRDDLAGELLSSALGAPPRVTLIVAPRGWGKRKLLDALAGSLRSHGVPVARSDLGRGVTNPDEFSCDLAGALLDAAIAHGGAPPPDPEPRAAGEALLARLAGRPPASARLRALAVSGFPPGLPRLARALGSLALEMSRRRGRGDAVVDLALEAPSLLAEDLGRPVVLVLDHVDEIQRLVPYPGLADAPLRLARALAGSPAVRVAAGVSPAGRPRTIVDSLARELGEEFAVKPVPPLGEAEIAALLEGHGGPGAAAAILGLTGGREATAVLLAERIRRGASLEEGLFEESAAGTGRLYQELRFDYHLLIERTRGHAAGRAILNVLAREEGLDLSGIASRLRRSAGSTLDYLRWLIEVDLLTREGRRYRFGDPLLRLHVLLHEVPERPGDDPARRALIRRFAASLEAEPIPLRPRGRPRGSRRVHAPPPADATVPASVPTRAAEEPPPPRRGGFSIEID